MLISQLRRLLRPLKGNSSRFMLNFFLYFFQFLSGSTQNHRIPNDISFFMKSLHFLCDFIAQWVENVEFLSFFEKS